MSKTILSAVIMALRDRMAKEDHRPFVLGICGAQGSGKSTLAEALAAELDGAGVSTAILSLDDIYKTKADRLAMAATVHPLFATRGVPGTHDIDLALSVLDSLERAEAAPLPRFDKAQDDRRPASAWPLAAADTRVLILEGWCVGARPEPDSALVRPINWLEDQEDEAGVWRRYVNDALAGEYQGLFARLDLLVMLAAPGFEIVHRWRTEQEHALRQQGNGGMADSEIERFVRHYERLTRHILADMPDYADVAVALDQARQPREIVIR